MCELKLKIRKAAYDYLDFKEILAYLSTQTYSRIHTFKSLLEMEMAETIEFKIPDGYAKIPGTKLDRFDQLVKVSKSQTTLVMREKQGDRFYESEPFELTIDMLGDGPF